MTVMSACVHCQALLALQRCGCWVDHHGITWCVTDPNQKHEPECGEQPERCEIGRAVSW